MSEEPWVAVVDDDESIRTSLIRLLRGCRIPARGFSSAAEFLDGMAGSAPTCAVCDVQLGLGLNGYDLKERMEAEGKDVPVIFMTGRAELPVRMCRDADAVANCLQKPFEPDEFLARVRLVLDARLQTTEQRNRDTP